MEIVLKVKVRNPIAILKKKKSVVARLRTFETRASLVSSVLVLKY